MGMIVSDDSLRAMYPGGRADATARRLAKLWAVVFQLGLMPSRWVTLEVAGRRSGRMTRFPLGMADWKGQHYLVPMLGEHCNWVQNVRAAGGAATLRRRRPVSCTLTEVPVSERPPIIKRYLEQVPGARPHIPVGRRAPVAEFEAIAERTPSSASSRRQHQPTWSRLHPGRAPPPQPSATRRPGPPAGGTGGGGFWAAPSWSSRLSWQPQALSSSCSRVHRCWRCPLAPSRRLASWTARGTWRQARWQGSASGKPPSV